LSPFVVLEHCEKCKSLQLFFLNRAEGKRIEFLSYQCGHVLEPPSYSSDLHDLRDFLLGRVPLKSLFERRGWAGRGNRDFVTPSGRDREIARRLLDLGDASLRDGRPEDAISFLRKALPLDLDSDRAHFLLGTALLYREDGIEEASVEFKEAGRLNPRNALAFLALANIARHSGDARTARDMLLRAHEADPGDAEVTAALAELGGNHQPDAVQRSDSE
jgi:tetratricopeptide (TPR) repeat protein